MTFAPVLLVAVLSAPLPQLSSHHLIEYHMHMEPSEGTKRVALTFDACTGKADVRILNALVENNIKATIFVTGRWLKRNPAAIATLKANTDLFEIENHGAKHLPAIDFSTRIFGLTSAGSGDAIKLEVLAGAAALNAAFGTSPQWYRGAAAKYTIGAMELIQSLNYKIAGFSLSGDNGATWSSSQAAKAIAAAMDGDVIIAHINQPSKPAGAGVVEGILKLKADGFNFVTLNEGF